MKDHEFLSGGGEMGALMRSHDWNATPLGDPSTWPQSLRTSVRLLLNTGHPMYIFWGAESICFYNDAYRLSIGDERHPSSLGKPAREVWAEIWPIIGPQIEQVMAGKGATWHENQLVPITRNGRREDVYWTYSYGPIDDSGSQNGVGGVLVVCTETTSQIYGAQQLALSEQRLQMALSAGRGVGTWDWDIVNNRVFADARFARLYGVDPNWAREGAPIAEFFTFIHPDDVPRVQKSIEIALRTGDRFSEEYRLIREGSASRWILAEGRCEISPEGRPVRFPGISLDITDRKNNEERLRELNARLEQKVIERAFSRGRTWQLSPELLSVLNADGYFLETNPAWDRVLGWSEDQVHARNFFDLVHPDDIERTRAAWQSALSESRAALRFENRCQRSDGSYRWLSWVAVPDDGTIYCSARDVTVEKEQADELAKRTMERNRAWQFSQDLLVVVDTLGMFTRVNAAWSAALGWSEADIIGKHFSDFVHPDDLEKTQLVFQDLMLQPLVIPYEYRFRNKSGGYDFTAWTAAFFDGLVYANGRVTTREHQQAESLRQAEEALRQSQKMEAVGQLTGGLAHDFNNLLTGIVGGLEMIQSRVEQGRIGEIDRYVTTAHGAARRAAALTHRLLAFSRRQTLAPRPTDLKQLIGGMEDLIQRTVGPSIEIETINAVELWPSLIDPGQLENSILNLCINARDAMPEGGKITIETDNRRIDARMAVERGLEPGQYISVCVSDTGTGMPPDVVIKAFDPFFTTKPIGMGTGLGLSMIYGFAKQSGGGVDIYSEVNQGTTVCIYLPRYLGATVAENGEANPDYSAQRGTGETVLVVDDEPSIRMLIADVLAELGYHSIEAVDGPSALRVLESTTHIDLLVTDVGLPGGMNGRQVADAARTRRPNLQVLFITGYAENAVIRHGHLEPGMHVLTKPFSMEVLTRRIRDLVAKDEKQ